LAATSAEPELRAVADGASASCFGSGYPRVPDRQRAHSRRRAPTAPFRAVRRLLSGADALLAL